MIIDPIFPAYQFLSKNNFDPIFYFDEIIKNKAYQFAVNQLSTSQNKYAQRGQNNANTIIEQIQTSKIVEEGVYEKLCPFLINLSKPDWNIYQAHQKNWNPDLIDNTTNPPISIGVKSQREEIGKKFGVSWIFEKREGFKYDIDQGVFGKNAQQFGHFICFASINLQEMTGKLQGLIAVSTLHKLDLF